jgi:hypothetical protein
MGFYINKSCILVSNTIKLDVYPLPHLGSDGRWRRCSWATIQHSWFCKLLYSLCGYWNIGVYSHNLMQRWYNYTIITNDCLYYNFIVMINTWCLFVTWCLLFKRVSLLPWLMISDTSKKTYIHESKGLDYGISMSWRIKKLLQMWKWH